MKLLILPGNSARNKEWADKGVEACSDNFADVYGHYYEHWETGKETDFDLEIRRVEHAFPIITSEPVAVLAKSAGSIITIYANYLRRWQLAQCLFVGLPLGNEKQAVQLKDWFARMMTPTTIIQNTNDPYSSHARVKDFLQSLSLPNITLIETPGDNHDYLDFDLIKAKAPGFSSISTS